MCSAVGTVGLSETQQSTQHLGRKKKVKNLNDTLMSTNIKGKRRGKNL